MIEIEKLQKYFSEDKIFVTGHIAERFHQRGIKISDIRNVINCGEIIHAVLSDEGTASRIITAYFPDSEKWSEDFKIRR